MGPVLAGGQPVRDPAEGRPVHNRVPTVEMWNAEYQGTGRRRSCRAALGQTAGLPSDRAPPSAPWLHMIAPPTRRYGRAAFTSQAKPGTGQHHNVPMASDPERRAVGGLSSGSGAAAGTIRRPAASAAPPKAPLW